MGNDYAETKVAKFDKDTGYPTDEWRHLLNPYSYWDGYLIHGWNKVGTELRYLTDPYGLLWFAIGNGDDFICFDYEMVDGIDEEGVQTGRSFIVLDAVLNSETAGFIEGVAYSILPVNTREEKEAAVNDAIGFMDCAFEDVRHSIKGWNQDIWYWARCVDRALFPEKYEAIRGLTERQMRFGGARVNTVFFRERRVCI